MLEFRLLGPLEVRDGERLVALPRQKQRALLAALLLRAGQVVARDRLIDDLWGEDPPSRAENALHNYLSQLRRALGADVVVTRSPGYLLRVTPDQVDSLRFERLVEDARGAGALERADLLRRALSLFRGPPLADVRFELFAQTEVSRLEELELVVRAELHDAELELGRHADIVPALEAFVAAHPYREHARAQLMLALYRCGRQAEALAVYQRGRAVLVEELGIDPGEELQELERAILRQDPALRLRATEAPSEPVAAAAPPRPTRRPSRKTVSVLAVARVLEGPAARDPESLRAATDRFVALATGVVAGHGGSVERGGADLTAVFGVPVAHEDDALRAVRAAVALRVALAEEGLAVRSAVTTGEAFVTEEAAGTITTGDVVHEAVRLAGSAAAGEILLGEESRRFVESSVTVERSDVQQAVRLVELDPAAGSRVLRLESALVGRERPLAALENALAGAVGDGRCHLFTVLGEAGVGKSRVVAEFVTRLAGGATVISGRCLPYGSPGPLAPLAEALGSTVAGGDAVSSTLRELESLARAGPLVVVLEDVHWAHAELLDLVELVAAQARNAPVLVVCLARPELHDLRPSWGGGMPNASSILLEPLGPEESERLIDNLLGQSDLPAPVRDHIVGAAEGNPLFLEELLAMLVDRAVLRREGDRWTTEELPVLAIPPTVKALIASRIDRIGDDERRVLETASIEGKLFHLETVSALMPGDRAGDVGPLLASLVRRELIRPASSGGNTFAFRHQLVRDAAYDSMPKRLRAELHETFAGLADGDEARRFHLEAAQGYRRELGEA